MMYNFKNCYLYTTPKQYTLQYIVTNKKFTSYLVNDCKGGVSLQSGINKCETTGEGVDDEGADEGGSGHETGAGKSPRGIQLVVFVGGFCTNPDVVGLFIEDGVLDWNGFPGYMRKVVRRGGGFFIKMGFRK